MAGRDRTMFFVRTGATARARPIPQYEFDEYVDKHKQLVDFKNERCSTKVSA